MSDLKILWAGQAIDIEPEAGFVRLTIQQDGEVIMRTTLSPKEATNLAEMFAAAVIEAEKQKIAFRTAMLARTAVLAPENQQ
jgi:hypothetical protein